METLKTNAMGSPENFLLRVLLYGLAGSGKTTLAGTAPKPILFFDFDGKIKSLHGKEGIEVKQYLLDRPEDSAKLWKSFMSDFREIKKDTFFKTIVFDSLTSMDALLLISCMINAGKEATAKPTIPIYGDQADNLKFFLMELPRIQKNVILTAHSEIISDEESGGVLEITPMLTGKKLPRKLPAMFEELWYLERKGGELDERILHYRPWKKANANSCFLKGNGEIKNPVWENIITQTK